MIPGERIMKIGLIDVDSKYPNLALMKIASWHKRQGHQIKWWNAFEPFDRVYASKIFTWSKTPYMPKNAFLGGSGANLETILPPEIEHMYPDYGLYQIDYAMGYITRGCINKCPFCIVWKKEGALRKVAGLAEFWHGQTKVMLLDNAITDCPAAISTLIDIRDLGITLDLQQGFNVRTITPATAAILVDIKLERNAQWHIAFDTWAELSKIERGLKILHDAGIPNYKLMCYVLVNYNSCLQDDVARIQWLADQGIDPFVMIYNKQKAPSELRRLAKWCNRPQLRKSCSFEDYWTKTTLMEEYQVK
jgi:hypothetical protein